MGGGRRADARHEEIAALRPECVRTLLDLGCGKGTLTARMAAGCDSAVAYDVSPTAIRIARDRYPSIEFRLLDRAPTDELAGQRFDLACTLELLSYLPDCVNSFDEPRAAVAEVAAIEELLVDDESVLILGAASRLAPEADGPVERIAASASQRRADA